MVNRKKKGFKVMSVSSIWELTPYGHDGFIQISNDIHRYLYRVWILTYPFTNGTYPFTNATYPYLDMNRDLYIDIYVDIYLQIDIYILF